MLLALFGLSTSGCFIPAMYGTPSADWSVKGRVTDEDNQPVAGIQVVLGNHFQSNEHVIYDQEYWPLDTLQTGPDGTFQASRGGFPIQQLKVDFQDIDGEENGGEFEAVSLMIRKIEYKDAKGWYSGRAEIEIPDVILKKK